MEKSEQTWLGGAQAPEFGDLQRLVDELFEDEPARMVGKLDAIERAQIDDLSEDLLEGKADAFYNCFNWNVFL